MLLPGQPDDALATTVAKLRQDFGGRCYLALTLRRRAGDAVRLHLLSEMAAVAEVPTVVAGDVLYHAPERRILQDVVTCILDPADAALIEDYLASTGVVVNVSTGMPCASRRSAPPRSRRAWTGRSSRMRPSFPMGSDFRGRNLASSGSRHVRQHRRAHDAAGEAECEAATRCLRSPRCIAAHPSLDRRDHALSPRRQRRISGATVRRPGPSRWTPRWP